MSLETYNSQYVQKCGTSAHASLAAAEALHILKAPLPETENQAFTTLDPSSDLDVKSALSALELLSRVKSERKDDYRMKCNERFGLATVFRSAEEIERMKEGLREESKKREEKAKAATSS